MICCGDEMEELIPNTAEAATEKHLPVISSKERLISAEIGSLAHPMTKEHHINFIYLQTEKGGQMKRLCVDSAPAAIYAVLDDSPVAVYAYCNLHGLWKTEVVACCCHNQADANENKPHSCPTCKTACKAE